MLLQQLHYAIRTLLKARGFTVAAVLSLAIGIGDSVAIFSLLNVVALKPLPYPDPDRLVLINEILPKYTATVVNQIQGGHILRWRTEIKSFASVGGAVGTFTNLMQGKQSESLPTVQMTADLFDVLGEKPQLGRWFRRLEEQTGQRDVAILSNSLWRRRFSGDPAIVGRKIVLDNKPYEVVGVTAAGMRFYKGQLDAFLPENPEIFVPLRLPPWELELNTIGSLSWCVAIARLRAGVTIDQAHAEMETYMAGFSRRNKEQIEVHSLVQPLQRALAGEARIGLMLLMGAAGFVLLIVCVNIANLMLVRAARTGHELTVRSALGASTRHLIGQSLLESLLIAVAGASLGVLAAWWITSLLIAGAPARLPRLDAVNVDGTVLFFSAALCIFSTLLCGLFPALHIGRISPLGSLPSAPHCQTDGPRDNFLRALLLGAEVGFATLLLIGAGLLLASLQRVLSVPRGFRTQNIHAMVVALPRNHYKTMEQKLSFFRQLERRLEMLPGVQHVSYANAVPLSGATSEGYTNSMITTASENVPYSQLPMASWISVSSQYLSTLDIPLRAGRFFEDGESHLVAVVSETAARRGWPGQNPIGRRFRSYLDSNKTHWFTVIGVAGDVRSTSLEHPSLPTVYYPYWQSAWEGHTGESILALYMRTAPLQDIVEAVRRQARALGPDAGVDDWGMLGDFVSKSVSERRFQTIVVAVFGIVALALACIGVYGVASYSMAQRQKEISIRMALGADKRDIVAFVLRHSMTPVLVGMVAGLVAATSLEGLIANFLFEVRPRDPTMFVAVASILGAFATLACYLPARRGSHADPVVALRGD